MNEGDGRAMALHLLLPSAFRQQVGNSRTSADFPHPTIKHRLRGSLKRGEGELNLCTIDLQERLTRATSQLRAAAQAI